MRYPTLRHSNLSIFDQVEREKQQGIEASYQHANSYWKSVASDAIRTVAQTHQEFTVDDVTEVINKTGVTTGEGRAIGAIMQSASRAGMIQKTGQYRECKIPRHHGLPKAIWRSNIYNA